MNIICGVLNQTEGEVFINGINLRTDPVEAKKYIGFLPQRPPLYPELSVDEYLTYCARLRLMDAREIRQAVDTAEAKCGITHFKKRLIGNLSGVISNGWELHRQSFIIRALWYWTNRLTGSIRCRS